MKILVTPTSMQPGKKSAALEKLKMYSDDLMFNPTGRPLTEEELIKMLPECDGYIAGLDHITAKVLEACPKLKVISRYGVGYERVDVDAARHHGIIVTNTPGANSEAVGELTMAMLLAVARRVPYLDRTTRDGEWVRSTGMELFGKTMGIMGLGAIGKVVARCAAGFGMKVIAYDPFINADYCAAHGIGNRTFEEVLKQSDVVSLHLPLLESTRHIIDAAAIDRMKDGTILLNASRGGLIDEKAACAALKSGKLGGLGMDAFEDEPPKGSPLFEFDNVVATPHTGAHTREATDTMARMSVENLIAVLEGQDCPFAVNR